MKNWMRFGLGVGLAAMMTASLAGAAFAEEKADTSDQLYIEVAALSNLSYFYDHQLGCAAAGEDLGVTTEYVGPAEYDMDAMIAAFETAIAKQPNGIAVIGFEDTLGPVIDKAVDAGIPVVTVDGDVNNCKRQCFVGTGNYNAGFQGGKYLAEAIGGKGQIAIMTKPGQDNLEQRIQGYQDALADYPDIEIVQIADTQSDSVVAAQAAASLLQMYPDLAGIACVEAAGGTGASTAIREAGKEGQVKIIAMDRDEDVLTAIEEGVITASVAQQSALMSYEAIQILYDVNNNDMAVTSDNAAAGVSGMPASVDTGVLIIDGSNYEYYRR